MNELKILILQKGYKSIEDFSNAIRIDPSTIRAYNRYQAKPRIDTFDKMLKKLDVSYEELSTILLNNE